jgi:hypothetical protein
MSTMFHRLKHVAVILAATTALAVGALSGAGVASAAAPLRHPGTTVPPVLVSQPQAVAIEAFPAGGKGSGSETTCNLYTQELQADQSIVNQATSEGDQEAIDKWSATLQSDTNSALDAGCAVID